MFGRIWPILGNRIAGLHCWMPISDEQRLKSSTVIAVNLLWVDRHRLQTANLRRKNMTTSGKQTIGRFIVEKRLGKGAQGSVYLARDPNLDRRVAVKILHPGDTQLSWSDGDTSPLEGRIASKLAHPNIVPIYDAGTHKGLPFLVFEFVQGRTLRQVLREDGALPIDRACSVIWSVLNGIGHAHAQGIIHLDLSPRNILVDTNRVARIMDFGLSRFAGSPGRSEAGVAGTIRYMSPEHFSDFDFGPYTDVFALASTFYEMVLGRPAMVGEVLSTW